MKEQTSNLEWEDHPPRHAGLTGATLALRQSQALKDGKSRNPNWKPLLEKSAPTSKRKKGS